MYILVQRSDGFLCVDRQVRSASILLHAEVFPLLRGQVGDVADATVVRVIVQGSSFSRTRECSFGTRLINSSPGRGED